MSKNIIIKQAYFTGIQTAINSLNDFFSSGFKTRNFPVLDGDFQLEPVVEKIISCLSNVDPTWIEDEERLREMLDLINDNLQKINPADGVYETIVNSNNETLISSIDGYIGFKMLQQIADNFQEFTKFINGIYTFEIFTKPAEYADVLNIFSSPLNFEELPELDIEETVFNEGFYVDGIMKNELISLPEDFDAEAETQRIYDRQNLADVDVFVDDSVQEAAEINYFDGYKPIHMKYGDKVNKWVVSKQFKECVDDFISELNKCDTTDDLKNFFSASSKKYAEMFSQTIVPYILVRTFTNDKKSSNDFDKDMFKKYTDSYESILKQNVGSRHFEKYDIFSTFKSDKTGTIKFIEDFLKLNLINDPNVAIENNVLLTIFNIFDSRIYLDIAHNVKGGEMKDENQFVKEIRSRINKNSRTVNSYNNDKNDTEENSDETITDDINPEKETSETISESFMREIRSLGDMTHSDMLYCEHYSGLLEKEIDTINDKMYNAGLSPYIIEEYIGGSFNDINIYMDYVQEADVTQRRSALQTSVNNLLSEMEEIVKLNKSHRWNNNTFVNRYRTSAGMFMLIPNVTGSSENHTDVKQVYHWTGKAVKGKIGSFTNDQIKTLSQLHELVGDIWGCVKIFWINPSNWIKHANIFNNTKTQKRVNDVAIIAEKIVNMKNDLEFLNDDNFVREAWYDGSSDFIFQEATTKVNNERLNKALSLLFRDMKNIQELVKKRQWTDNACISIFKSESMGNLKQAIKYVNYAMGGSCGKYSDDNIDTLDEFRKELTDLKKVVNKILINPLIGKTIKESPDVHKVAIYAKKIVEYENKLDFVKGVDTTTQESFVFQESKLTNFRRTLKKFDYDPKTDTIKTDINLPGGKEKMRVKLSIDDDISRVYGACVTNLVIRDSSGNIVTDPDTGLGKTDPTKYEIHVTRKSLKQKPWKAAFILKHEEGHINYDHINIQNGSDPISPNYDADKAFGQERLAQKHIKDSKMHNDLNEHDNKRIEYVADKYAAEHTSKRSVIKGLDALYKSSKDQLLCINMVDEDYKKAKAEVKNARKHLKDMTPEQAESIKKRIIDLNKKIDEIVDSLNSELHKLKESGITKESTQDDDLNKINELKKQGRHIKHELREIKQSDYRSLLKKAEDALEDASECLRTAENGCKLRQQFIQKYVKECDVIDLDTFILIMEQEDGSLPEYMKQRYKMSDGNETSITPTDLPEGVPVNPVPEMTDSIDAKMSTNSDNLSDMLGSGFENNPNKKDVEGKIVVNITNNYNNSFNRDSGNTITNDDHSTNKTTTTTNTDSNNNSSHHNNYDSSKNKNEKMLGHTKGANNNNNSNESIDTKDSPTKKDGEQKLSSGQTLQEMFMFLESEEPLSNSIDAGKPPKEDTLTKAMDRDRKSLARQQKAKKNVQKTVNTGKALLKPITRIKQWLVKVSDSIIKRDEDHVKAELIENPSYRSAVYKATRIALTLGLTGFVFTIQPYIAAAMIGVAGLRAADSRRLREEVRQELEAEIDIIDRKIHDLEYNRGSIKDADKQKYEYMRLKKKLEGDLMRITKSHIKRPGDTI